MQNPKLPDIAIKRLLNVYNEHNHTYVIEVGFFKK